MLKGTYRSIFNNTLNYSIESEIETKDHVILPQKTVFIWIFFRIYSANNKCMDNDNKYSDENWQLALYPTA